MLVWLMPKEIPDTACCTPCLWMGINDASQGKWQVSFSYVKGVVYRCEMSGFLINGIYVFKVKRNLVRVININMYNMSVLAGKAMGYIIFEILYKSILNLYIYLIKFRIHLSQVLLKLHFNCPSSLPVLLHMQKLSPDTAPRGWGDTVYRKVLNVFRKGHSRYMSIVNKSMLENSNQT